MTKLHRRTTDERLYAPAEDAFTPEDGTLSSGQSDRERQMAEFSVGHHGLRYHYNGYRYDRYDELSDAVNYAKLAPQQRDDRG